MGPKWRGRRGGCPPPPLENVWKRRSPESERRRSNSEQTEVVPDPHRAEPHVEVGEADPEKAEPRPKHVPAIEAAHAAIGLIASGRPRKLIAKSADDMTQRMTAEREAAQKDDVDEQDERADPKAERSLSSRRIDEPKRFPDIDREDDDKQKREIKKIAVHVLHDQRKRALTEIGFARLADCTGGR